MKALWNKRFTVLSTLVLGGMVTMLVACAKPNPPALPPITTGGGTTPYGTGYTGSIGGGNCPTVSGALPFRPQNAMPYYATLQGQDGLNGIELRLSHLTPPSVGAQQSQFVGSVGFSLPGLNLPGCASTVRPRTSTPMPGTLFPSNYSEVNATFWGVVQVPAQPVIGGPVSYYQQQQIMTTQEATVVIGGSCPAYIQSDTVVCGQGCGNCIHLWIGDRYYGYGIQGQSNTGYNQYQNQYPGYGYGY